MNINGYFIFDGFDTRTLPGVTVVRGETLESPAREFDVREIPGRNGNLLLDNRKYPNTEITYHVMIRENVESTFRQLAGFLLSRTGYCKLSDSWSTSEFYLAYVSQPIVPTVSRGDELGTFEVVFNRKPQRFLVSGETEYSNSEYPNTVVVDNPTYFESRPIIKFTPTSAGLSQHETGFFSVCAHYATVGTGFRLYQDIGFILSSSETLGDLVSAGDEIILDCEARVAVTASGVDLNNRISFRDDTQITPVYDFPAFLPSVRNGILGQYSRVTDIKITPRWWSI